MSTTDALFTLEGCKVALTGYDEKGDLFCDYLKSSEGGEDAFNYDTKSYDECKTFIENMGGTVDPHVSSDTTFVVARKGLTNKRLVADEHEMFVVTPLFLDDAEHNHRIVTRKSGEKLTDLRRIASMYAVPYLYNYIVSAALLSSIEEETSLRRIVEQNGGRYFKAPYAFTDVLFVSAEVCGRVKAWAQKLSKDEIIVKRSKEVAEAGGKFTARDRYTNVSDRLYSSADKDTLAPEIIFSIVYDVPILNYNKFFSIAKLPSNGGTTATPPPYDFGTLIEHCEVVIPSSIVNWLIYFETRKEKERSVSCRASPMKHRSVDVSINSTEHDNGKNMLETDSSEADELESAASSFSVIFEEAAETDDRYLVQETEGTIAGDYFSPNETGQEGEMGGPLAPMVSHYFNVKNASETNDRLFLAQSIAKEPTGGNSPPRVASREPVALTSPHQPEKRTVDKSQYNYAANLSLFTVLQVPPFLTVCLLHCTPQELNEAIVSCIGCRFLRVPVLTDTVDIVVLGSKCLRKKKYVIGKEKAHKQLRGAEDSTKKVRDFSFYECANHQLIYLLEKRFGLSKTRIAPLAWLRECFQLSKEVISSSSSRIKDSRAEESLRSTWVEETCNIPTQTIFFETEGEASSANEAPFDPEPFYSCSENRLTGERQFQHKSFVEQFLPRLHAIGVGKYTIKLSRNDHYATVDDTADVPYVRVEESLKIAPRISPPPPAPTTEKENIPEQSFSEALLKLTAPYKKEEKTVAVPCEVAPTVPNAIHLPHASTEDAYKRELAEVREKLDAIWGIVAAPHGDETATEVKRRSVFEGLLFCFVEGEFNRTDLGVVRGLIKMGSGESLKKTNEVWKEALSQPSQKGEEQQCFQAIRSNALLGKKYKKWLDDMKSPTQANEALRLRLLERILAEENNDTTLQPSSLMESSQQWLTDVSRFSASMSFAHPDEYSVSVNPSKEKLPSSTESVDSLLEAIPKLLNVAGKNPALYVQPHSFQTPSAALHPNGNSKSTMAGKNALRYLVHINSNYLICCLAADKLLNPHACFVFCNTVSSSPDGMKHKERQISKKASKGKSEVQVQSRDSPSLSPWVMQKRYAKPNSIGVTCSFVWKLPFDSMETTVDGSWVPCTKVIPLIKSLLYVFNNMVVALQGKTADHYHHNVVTHVVVVDVVTILETPFSLVLEKEDFSAYKKSLRHTPTQCDSEHANLFAAANDPDNRPNYYYWPMEELDDAIKDHTKDAKGEGPLLNHTSKSVSIVEDRYLASCASWGVFVDESGDTFTPNLTHFLEERRQVAFQDTPSTPKVHATPPPRRPTEEPFATPRRSGSRAASTNTKAHHDEESAYLGRLTEMFNFRTPTSTPVGSARAALLNSSARKKMRSLRESSQCRSQQAHSSQILSQALRLTKLSQTPLHGDAPKHTSSPLHTPFVTVLDNSRGSHDSASNSLLKAGVVCTPPLTAQERSTSLSPMKSLPSSRKRGRLEEEEGVDFVQDSFPAVRSSVAKALRLDENSSSSLARWNPSLSQKSYRGEVDAKGSAVLVANSFVPETFANPNQEDRLTERDQHGRKSEKQRGLVIGDSENASTRTTTHLATHVVGSQPAEDDGVIRSSQQQRKTTDETIEAHDQEDTRARIGKSVSPPPQPLPVVVDCDEGNENSNRSAEKPHRCRSVSKPISLASRSITPVPEPNRGGEGELVVYVLHDVPSREELVSACSQGEGCGRRFVTITEDVLKASIVVASVMNSRESLLLSIAAGKWVVLPDWLERVATYCKNEKNVGNDEKEWTRVVHLFSSWLSSSEWSLEHFMSVTEEPKESSSTAQSYWLHRQLAKVCAAHRQQRQLTGNTVLGGRSFLLLTPLFSTVGKGGKRTRDSTEQCLYRNEGVPSIKRIVRAGGGSLLNTVGITSLEKKDGATLDHTPYTYFILDGEVSVKVEETTLGSVTLPLAAETFLTDFMLLLFAQFVLSEDSTTLVASRTDVLVDSVERIRVTAGHRSKRKKRVTLKLTVFLEELREIVADDSLLDSLDRSEEEIKAYYFFKKTLQLISYHRSLQQRNAPNTSYFAATAPATLPLEGKRAWDAEWRSFILRYTAQQTDMHSTLGQQITQSTASLTNQLPSKEKFSLSVKSIDCIAHAIAGDEESGATLVTFTV